MPNGPMRITGLPFEANNFESDHKIEDEEIKVRSLLQLSKSEFNGLDASWYNLFHSIPSVKRKF